MRKQALQGSSHIYVITEGEFTKIGVAKDPRFRLTQLQVGNPRKLTLVECWHFPAAAEAYRLERVALNKLATQVARGEWIALPAEQVLKTVRPMFEYTGPIRINLAIQPRQEPNWAALRSPKDAA